MPASRREFSELVLWFPLILGLVYPFQEDPLIPPDAPENRHREDPSYPPPPLAPWRMPRTTHWPPRDPITCLACTAWMENREGGKRGMQSVMNVIMNRVHNPGWWGNTIVSVCLSPWQFAVWNKGSTQLVPVLEAMQGGDLEWDIAMDLAALASQGMLLDITGNADSYYAPRSIRAPIWATSALYTRTIGGNKFYRVYLPAFVR